MKTLKRVRERYRELEGQANDAEWVAHCYRELAELDAALGEYELALSRTLTARRFFLQAQIEIHAPQALVALNQRIAELRVLTTRNAQEDS